MKAWITLFSCLIATALFGHQEDASITIRTNPEKVFGVVKSQSQELNFDFEIKNQSQEKLMLQEIRMRAFDKEGKLMFWKKIDGNGSRPSILLAGSNMIDPDGSLYLFNPFQTFDTNLPISLLKYEFIFASRQTGTKRIYHDVIPDYTKPKTQLISPVPEGTVWVYDGSDFSSHHRRIDPTEQMNREILKLTGNAQRFALDLVPVNAAGEAYKGDLRNAENWIGYGAKIHAPAGGKVVIMENDQPNAIQFNMGQMKSDPKIGLGNYLVIDHENGEFSLMAHFIKGSLQVKAGQRIKQGDYLGEMGRSGMGVGLVHLHYELRTSSNVFKGEGLPIYFGDFSRVIGSKRISVKKGYLDTGVLFTTTKK